MQVPIEAIPTPTLAWVRGGDGFALTAANSAALDLLGKPFEQLAGVRIRDFERALGESESRYRALFEQSPAGILVHASDLRASPAAHTRLRPPRFAR